MSNQRPSFAKRDREMRLKDKARQKAERRADKKATKLAGGPSGPPIEGITDDFGEVGAIEISANGTVRIKDTSVGKSAADTPAAPAPPAAPARPPVK